MARKARKAAGRKGGSGGGSGGRKGGDPPPRNRGDLRCINCGGKNHTWRDCREPEVPREKRPCLNCGKPGHISRDCRQPKALTVDGGGDTGRHFNLDGDQEARSCEADTPNFRDPHWTRGRSVFDADGFQRVDRGPQRVSLGDLPVRAPKMSQREARTFRFSQHAAINVCERAPAPADVSSLVIAAPLDGFQTSGATGGQVEPGPVTKRSGCSGATGVDLVSLAEAELDRRERVLAQTVGSEEKHTYFDILTRNVHNTSTCITPVSTPAATNARQLAMLGEPEQLQRRSAAQAGGASTSASRPTMT